jgi:glycosyltransferase involved in cell wall biosynthesis
MQSYPEKEIIVVDDGSTEGTADALFRMSRDYSMHVFFQKHQGITVTRNAGFNYSIGDIVFFGEADAIYSRDYVAKALKLLSANQEMGGVCLTGAPWITKSTIVTTCIDVENKIQRKLLREGRREPFYAWVFRRKALEEIGGFDERLFQAEDKDVFLRVKKGGFTIGLVSGINWRHRRNQTLGVFLRRNFWGGKTRILYLITHRKIRELFQAVSLLWFLLITGLFGVILSPTFYYMAILGFSATFVYKLIPILREGSSFIKEKRLFLLFPLFSLLRHLSSAVGYTIGLSIFIFRKIANKPVDWSSMR